jgi:hypothetical protein
MKLPPLHVSRFTFHASRPPRRQSGSAVIVVMALLAIILIYVAANLRTLTSLGRELKLLERQQIRRLQTAAPRTNSPPAITVSSNSVPGTPTQ